MNIKDIITIFTFSFGGCLLLLHFVPDSQIQMIGLKFVDIGFIMWIELWKTIHHDCHLVSKIVAKIFRRRNDRKEQVKKIERSGIL